MKKFYLTVQQRRTIINLALEDAKEAEDELKKEPRTGKVLEMIEAAIQDYRALASLMKVEEHEDV